VQPGPAAASGADLLLGEPNSRAKRPTGAVLLPQDPPHLRPQRQNAVSGSGRITSRYRALI
jgi:hypothetical protein